MSQEKIADIYLALPAGVRELTWKFFDDEEWIYQRTRTWTMVNVEIYKLGRILTHFTQDYHMIMCGLRHMGEFHYIDTTPIRHLGFQVVVQNFPGPIENS